MGDDGADARAQAKAMAAEAEGMDQSRRGSARAEHRQMVGRAALHAAPEPDDVGLGDARDNGDGALQGGQLGGIHVHTDHLHAGSGEAGARHQPHTTTAEDGDRGGVFRLKQQRSGAGDDA